MNTLSITLVSQPDYDALNLLVRDGWQVFASEVVEDYVRLTLIEHEV
jgi:hypothetical protein